MLGFHDSRVLSAAAVVGVLALLSSACSTQAEELTEPLADDYKEERLLPWQPIDDQSFDLDPEPYCCEDYFPPPAELYYLRFRGGGSYLDSDTQTDLGGAYGLDVIVPVSKTVGVYASTTANHVSGATQLLWTTGVMKGGWYMPGRGFTPLPPPSTPLEEFAARFSYSVLFDNLVLFDLPTEGRIDNLYVGQIRSTLSFRLSRDAAIGLVYTKPIRSDVARFPTAIGPITMPLEFSEGIAVSASGWWRNTMLTGSLGYRDGLNTMSYSGSVRRPISNRLTAFVNANYQDEGQWAGFAGVEIALGPSSRRSGYGCSSGCCAAAGDRHRSVAGDIVRGQPLTEEQRQELAAARRAYFEGICGIPALRYRARSGDPFDDPANSEALNNNNDPATAMNGMGGMAEMMQMMMGMMELNGDEECPPGFIESPPGSGMCFPLPDGF